MARLRESPRVLQVFAVAWLVWFPLGSLFYGAWGFFHLALLAALFAPEARRYVWRRENLSD